MDAERSFFEQKTLSKFERKTLNAVKKFERWTVELNYFFERQQAWWEQTLQAASVVKRETWLFLAPLKKNRCFYILISKKVSIFFDFEMCFF